MTPTTPDLDALKREVSKLVFNAEHITGAAGRIIDHLSATGRLNTGVSDDAEGSTPSSQKGGCDYVSFSDATKIFSDYVGQELRDPCGMNDVAKAMCSYMRMVAALRAQTPDGGMPIEKQFDGKTFRLMGGVYGSIEDVSITVLDYSFPAAAKESV